MKTFDYIKQFVVFGQFGNIDCGMQTYEKLKSIMEKYNLNFLTVPDNDVVAYVPVSGINIMKPYLFRDDRTISIKFNSNRIDIQVNFINADLLDEWLSQVKDIVEILFHEFKFKVSRMAYNGNIVTDDIKDDNIFKKWYLRYYKEADYQKFMEWSLRFGKKDILGAEKINVIYQTAKTQLNVPNEEKQVEQKNCLMISYDINTLAENTDCRFELADVLKFIDQASKLKQSMIREFEGFTNAI